MGFGLILLSVAIGFFGSIGIAYMLVRFCDKRNQADSFLYDPVAQIELTDGLIPV